MSHYTYLAFHNNKTFKVGHSHRVFERVTVDQANSSDCFLCVRCEHNDIHEAKEVEKMAKIMLEPQRIKNATCKEWFYSNSKTLKGLVQRVLNKINKYSINNKKKDAFFEIAIGLGVKSKTTWDAKTLKQTKTIIKKI